MRVLARSLAALVLVCAAPRALAQCGEGTVGFAAAAQPGDGIGGFAALASFDRGSGPELYAAARRASSQFGVWRWNGAQWQLAFSAAPGTTVGGLWEVRTASGPELVFGVWTTTLSTTTRLYRYDGTSWTTLGAALNFRVRDVDYVDFGAGPILCAGGYASAFGDPGSVSRWNGSTWSSLGYTGSSVYALAAFDDGSGPKLCAGGVLANGGTSLQTWNGASWSPLPANPSGQLLSSLTVFNGDLYAGTYSVGGGLSVWNGASWTNASPYTWIAALANVDFGAGPRLVVCSDSKVGFFDGASFTETPAPFTYGGVTSVAGGRAYGATRAYVSGSLIAAGSIRCSGIASTEGFGWETLGRGFDRAVNVLAGHTGASGSGLFAAGYFGTAGYDGNMHEIARWDGAHWSDSGAAGPVADDVYALLSADFGAGPELYLGGTRVQGVSTRGLVRWNGTSWVTFAPDVGGAVTCLTRFDPGTGPRLVAGGAFTLNGGVGTRIAAWDGASWSQLGTGLNFHVNALALHDEGGGSRLFAGGEFNSAGGVPALRIARWDGTSWSAVGAGITDAFNSPTVQALCSFDDGHGAQLYAGGTFLTAGSSSARGLARWDGANWNSVPGWSAIAGGTDAHVYALHVHDDGRGPALYVGGEFEIASTHLVRFDGAQWELVDGGLDGEVRALASFDDDGDGDPELFAGGDFTSTANVAAGRIARFAGCPSTQLFCFGDGSPGDHTTPCPCGNTGAAGHGCAHSASATGARLAPSGSPALDTVVLDATDMPVTALGIYLQHDAQDDRVFHDGVSCAGGNLLRLRVRTASGGASRFPDATFAQDATLTLSQRGLVTPGSGATRYYSTFYRNASSTFCPPATANVTNGVRVIW